LSPSNTTTLMAHQGAANGGSGGNTANGGPAALAASTAASLVTSPAALTSHQQLPPAQAQQHPQPQLPQQHNPMTRTPAFVSDLDRDWMLQEISWEDLKIIEKIGSGAFGDVFLARLWGQEVAVKKLLSRNLFTSPSAAASPVGPQNAPSPSLIADFMREVSILRNLRHPNILGFMGMWYVSNQRIHAPAISLIIVLD
jgi:serine/threonine protein kinase